MNAVTTGTQMSFPSVSTNVFHAITAMRIAAGVLGFFWGTYYAHNPQMGPLAQWIGLAMVVAACIPMGTGLAVAFSNLAPPRFRAASGLIALAMLALIVTHMTGLFEVSRGIRAGLMITTVGLGLCAASINSLSVQMITRALLQQEDRPTDARRARDIEARKSKA